MILRWLFLIGFLCPVYCTAAPVQMGVDVFLHGYTHLVKGVRVGLITNPTGRTATGLSTIEALQRHPAVNLKALFALEHGIDGKIEAGEQVKDEKYGDLPVYSLYGGQHRREGLNRIDVLIYDVQDVGSRAYTYIWSLTQMMADAAAMQKKVLVLDRPNPLGGLTVDGPIAEEKWLSLIGLYPVPRTYGMTVGELARYINQEQGIHCQLTVVPMAGYRRNMRWEELRRKWIPSSPNIPSPASAICFAATGTIGTLGTLHIGILTETPFQLVGAPWANAEVTARALTEMKLPGVRFRPMTFVPKRGLFRGQKVQGVFLDVFDPIRFQPARTEVAMLWHFLKQYPQSFNIPQNRYDQFDKAMGTSLVREALLRGDDLRQIWMRWAPEVLAFSQKRQPYLLYRSGATE